MAIDPGIQALIYATPFVDTHEHLWEEETRVRGLEKGEASGMPPPDFSVFLSHYAPDDLVSAGMPRADVEALWRWDLKPRAKWDLIAPHWDSVRHTGYFQAARESIRVLTGVEDLRAETCEEISRHARELIRPGFYHRVLREVARIEHAQVNSVEIPVFMETAQPDLLAQDLCTFDLATELKIAEIGVRAKREVGSLADWHAVIDWCFETFGPRAIAVKNQGAYVRGLDYEDVSAEDAAPLFARHLHDPDGLAPAERKALQDHLFHFTVRRATELRLPVKLHTGYFVGTDTMPLARVRRNLGDLCPVFRAHPDARFVVMHICYPYQDEAIAAAKHFSNVWVDMCWAWIINPAAGVRFVREFLMGAPANKLFTFGGDFMPVEMVPGHADLARRGLAQALSDLVEEGWLARGEVGPLVERLMRGNAHALFDFEGTLRRWGAETT